MLIGVMGAPITGKTTLAAGLFARLKEMGIAAEFVPEYARRYIATMAADNRSGACRPLCDTDQTMIARGQALDEDLFVGSGTQVVVTDGSVANAYFYMDGVSEVDLMHGVRSAMGRYDVLFYARPFDVRVDVEWDPISGSPAGIRPSADPNRVHDAEFSARLDGRIASIVNKTTGAGGAWTTGFVHRLAGSPPERLADALRVVTIRLEVFAQCGM